MPFDNDQAVQLWTTVYHLGFDGWDLQTEVEEIAGRCNLGVLTIEAMHNAMNSIGDDMRVKGRFNRELYFRLDPTIYSPRWARLLLAAAQKFPWRKDDYPILPPNNHAIGQPPCFGPARKGRWSDGCYRAAWGNVEPYGLELAEKPCPYCQEPMRYWCYGKRGEKAFKWSVDHTKSHVTGGCVCHFNLQAMHSTCNSSKNKN